MKCLVKNRSARPVRCAHRIGCIFPNTCKYNKMCMQSEINKAEQRRIDGNKFSKST